MRSFQSNKFHLRYKIPYNEQVNSVTVSSSRNHQRIVKFLVMEKNAHFLRPNFIIRFRCKDGKENCKLSLKRVFGKTSGDNMSPKMLTEQIIKYLPKIYLTG